MLVNAGSTPETCPCHQDNSSAPAQLVCLCNGSRHQAPIDGASLWLLHRCEVEADPRCGARLFAPAIRRRALLATSTTPLHLQVLCLCSGAAMDIRLIEQASLRLLHGASQRQAQGGCSSPPVGALIKSACRKHHSPAPAPVLCLCNGSRHGPSTDRASLRLLYGVRWRRTQGAVLASARWHSDGECLPPGTCRWFYLFNESRHGPPTDRASLCWLHGARRRQAQGARLCRWHSDGECLPPGTRRWFCLCNGSRHGPVK